MDGKGRWADNVYIERLWRSIKYEAVYLHSFDTMHQARETLARYITFYNQQRPHQALGYKTPDHVYKHSEQQLALLTHDSLTYLNEGDHLSQIQPTFLS